MSVKIKLTIHEIVHDYEFIIRMDEHITTLDEIDRLDEENLSEFKSEMEDMIDKYIPTYERHLPARYFSEYTSDNERAKILFETLQENFNHMFYQLV